MVSSRPQIASHRLQTGQALRDSAAACVSMARSSPRADAQRGAHYCASRSSVPCMDTTQLLKGVLDLAVLAVVDDEDGYGYDIVRRLRDGGLEDVGDASVYGTLRRLYAAGALTSYVVPSDSGPHRKYYGITTAGRAQLKQQSDDWSTFSRTVTAHPRGSPRMNTILTTPDVEAVRHRGARAPRRPHRGGAGGAPGGLEADLSDLVEERGVDALPDPRTTPASCAPRRASPRRLRPWTGVREHSLPGPSGRWTPRASDGSASPVDCPATRGSSWSRCAPPGGWCAPGSPYSWSTCCGGAAATTTGSRRSLP